MSAETHLVAGCVNCGAPQPIQLAADVGACTHCGHDEPVEASLRGRLDRMRAELANRDAKTRQLTAKSLIEGDALHGVGLITIGICWALFGGIGTYIAFQHDVGATEFLRGGKPAPQWWLLWAIAVGLSTSMALLELGVARVRGLSARALPAPPAADGHQPRCRYCAAELPVGSALRRCTHCRSDNLVITGRYLKAERDLDRALEAIVDRFDTDLEKRIETGDKIAMTGGVAPFFLLFIGPAIGLATPGRPDLWAVPGVIAAIAVLLAVLARVRRLPVEAVELLGLGQSVYARGDDQPRRNVSAQLMLAEGPVSLLGTKSGESQLGVHAARSDDSLAVTVYRVKPGSTPISDEAKARLQPVELWRHNGDDAPIIERVRVLFERDGWRTFGDDDTPLLQGFPTDKPLLIVAL